MSNRLRILRERLAAEKARKTPGAEGFERDCWLPLKGYLRHEIPEPRPQRDRAVPETVVNKF